MRIYKEQRFLFRVGQFEIFGIPLKYVLLTVNCLVFLIQRHENIVDVRRKRNHRIYNGQRLCIAVSLYAGLSIEFEIFLAGYASRLNGCVVHRQNQANTLRTVRIFGMKDITDIQRTNEPLAIRHDLLFSDQEAF